MKSGAVDPPADQGGVLVDDTIAYSYVVTNTGNVDPHTGRGQRSHGRPGHLPDAARRPSRRAIR